MENNWKLSNDQIILLFGALFFSLGLLGLIQIGILEGVSELIVASLIIFLLGIGFLLLLILRKNI